MLQKKVTNRISIDEIYEHEWITGVKKKKNYHLVFNENLTLLEIGEENQNKY